MNAEPTDDPRHDDFLRLFTANEPPLYGFVRSLVPTREDAREIMQEVVLVLWRKFSAYRTGEDFRRWAFTVARYEVLAYVRDRARDRHVFGDDVFSLLADQALEMNERLDAQRAALEECMQKLPADQRALVVAAYTPGARIDRLAEQCGRTAMSLYKKLQRIRLVLLDCVQKSLPKEALG
jgi:RNA polymerase sigma-70 factor, ECF subfamily